MLATAIPHLLTLLLSLFIAIYFRPAEPAGRLFALLCLLYGLSGLEVFPRWGGVAFYTLAVLATIFISPTLLHFALVFPRQEEAIAGAARRWWSWLRTALYAPFILLAPFWLFFSLRSGEILAQMQTALMTPEALTWRDLAGALGVLLGEGTNLLLRSVAWVIGGYALVCAWRTLGQARRAPQAAGAELAAAARAQNQLKWVALGAGVAGTGLMLWTLLLFPVISHMGGWGDVVIKLFLMALPLATAVAILGYRLWDADVLINRTLVYGTLTGLLAGVYALVVAALSGLVGRTSPFPSLIAALVVAALFGRGRDWVQDRVDRAFYRSKLEFRRHLRELRQMLSTTIVRNDLVRLLTVTVPERLQLAEAWLVEPAMVDLAQAEQGLLERGAALVLPLAVGEETVGLYGLGSKRSGVPLNREERDLLTDLSYQAAVALANAQTNEALLAEYKRRERMLMEIHDTVLGELGAAMVGIENAKTRIVQQPAEAQHRLAVAQDAVRASMKELRQVITVLRPELPRLSLPEALQREMTRFARRGEFRGDFHVQGEPRLLSDSIIETLAGITREALNNVLKHAKADQVNVVLAYEEHRIRLVVRDNGVGFQPEQRTQGTGLRNMARRAEEAGGTLLVQSTPGEGTRIEVWIPTKEPALSEVKGGGNEN
jgi:signal transduction histidine kinase